MAMSVQLILLLRIYVACADVDVSVIVLLAGEGSSTTVDDVMKGGGDHNMLLLCPHRRPHRNNQLRTISIIYNKGTHALMYITHNRDCYVKCSI